MSCVPLGRGLKLQRDLCLTHTLATHSRACIVYFLKQFLKNMFGMILQLFCFTSDDDGGTGGGPRRGGGGGAREGRTRLIDEEHRINTDPDSQDSSSDFYTDGMDGSR